MAHCFYSHCATFLCRTVRTARKCEIVAEGTSLNGENRLFQHLNVSCGCLSVSAIVNETTTIDYVIIPLGQVWTSNQI